MPRLYAVADADVLGLDRLVAGFETLVAAGVGWIQTRCKAVSDAALWECLERIHAGSSARWWVNDRPDLAALLTADGVHLGQEDLSPGSARAVVGDAVWIGRSTHDRSELDEAAADPDVDLIAVGPIFPTSGKADPRPVVGLELLRWARARTSKPLVAIGGIDETNAAAALDAGADSVAVLGAICRGDVAANARRLLVATAG